MGKSVGMVSRLLFGTVWGGLLVGSPLDAFLLGSMLLVWLLINMEGMPDEHSPPVIVPGFRGDAGTDWISGSGGGVKRGQLNRKTPAHLIRHGILGVQSRPRVCKRLRIWEHPGFYLTDAKAMNVHQSGEQYASVVVSRLCMRLNLVLLALHASVLWIYTHSMPTLKQKQQHEQVQQHELQHEQ